MRFVKLYDDAMMPTRATTGSAGYDLHAYRDAVIMPGEYKLIKTGVTFKPDYNGQAIELQVRPRSGLANKHGVTVLNAPGTVDGDYFPNEIGVILINHGDKPHEIKALDRIAQAVISTYIITDDDTAEAQRSSGFGSTGVGVYDR